MQNLHDRYTCDSTAAQHNLSESVTGFHHQVYSSSNVYIHSPHRVRRYSATYFHHHQSQSDVKGKTHKGASIPDPPPWQIPSSPHRLPAETCGVASAPSSTFPSVVVHDDILRARHDRARQSADTRETRFHTCLPTRAQVGAPHA